MCTTMWTTGMWGKFLGDTRISSVTTSRGEVGGGREVHEGGDICILIAVHTREADTPFNYLLI